jgi:hypothetical protein
MQHDAGAADVWHQGCVAALGWLMAPQRPAG